MKADPSIVKAFAPTGILRVAINLGNPVLAKAATGGGEPGGVSVDIARALAERLGVDCRFDAVDAAGKSVDLIEREDADVGFFAIDPKRGKLIAFTAPYVLIEGTYLVREDSPLRDIGDVDRTGNRIVVGDKSAYDLFLTREIKEATIVRTALSERVVDTFIETGAEVAAGVRQQLERDAKRVPNVRVLDGRFMTIRQAMGVAKSRGAQAAAYLCAFVEELKAGGFVAQALARNLVQGASVAPPGDLG
jgi:polar amino acid transport system substrate-binding protein